MRNRGFQRSVAPLAGSRAAPLDDRTLQARLCLAFIYRPWGDMRGAVLRFVKALLSQRASPSALLPKGYCPFGIPRYRPFGRRARSDAPLYKGPSFAKGFALHPFKGHRPLKIPCYCPSGVTARFRGYDRLWKGAIFFSVFRGRHNFRLPLSPRAWAARKDR